MVKCCKDLQGYLFFYSHSVESRLGRQSQRSFLSFPTKVGYDIVLVNQYCKLRLLQEGGCLVFTARQHAGSLSPYPSLSKNIVVHQFISYMFIIFFLFVCTYGIHCLFHTFSVQKNFEAFFYPEKTTISKSNQYEQIKILGFFTNILPESDLNYIHIIATYFKQ